MKQDPNYVPLVMLRAARKEDASLERTRSDFRKLFGIEITISYDFRDLYDTLVKDMDQIERQDYRGDSENICRSLPKHVAWYLEYAVLKLKALAFYDDELYRSEWLKAAPKGVKFEVVEELQTDSPHNECIYQDGFFRLRTTAKYFGRHHETIADRAVELLS